MEIFVSTDDLESVVYVSGRKTYHVCYIKAQIYFIMKCLEKYDIFVLSLIHHPFLIHFQMCKIMQQKILSLISIISCVFL